MSTRLRNYIGRDLTFIQTINKGRIYHPYILKSGLQSQCRDIDLMSIIHKASMKMSLTELRRLGFGWTLGYTSRGALWRPC